MRLVGDDTRRGPRATTSKEHPAMTIPVTGPIQFVPPGGVFLTVDSITDPGGAPADVIDVDLGFTVSGTVVLPNWLAGTGTVTIYADEQGGPIDKALQPPRRSHSPRRTPSRTRRPIPGRSRSPGTSFRTPPAARRSTVSSRSSCTRARRPTSPGSSCWAITSSTEPSRRAAPGRTGAPARDHREY